ncbi:DUF2599 domain-containing protein [Ureibacillus sinduriensis]|uniref:DUF2599 domain-containing protein n=1 Tax=Ureibacillus sinduriensis TaxID=561440 RepID=UPI000564F27E|nr:DUF2599 domain-containing protein [Ureibacillus sinduriensis]
MNEEYIGFALLTLTVLIASFLSFGSWTIFAALKSTERNNRLKNKITITLFSTILFAVFLPSTASQAKNETNYQLFGSSITNDNMKKWELIFNTNINAKTVNSNSIYVMQGANKVNGTSLTVGPDKKSVKIMPPDQGYSFGQSYTIYVEDTIKSNTGNKIKQKLAYEFSVQELDYNQYHFDDYFEKVEWINRSGVVSLSIYPKTYIVNKPVGHELLKHKELSFQLLNERFKDDSRWKNNESLKQQFACHVDFAGTSKVPWNIEPHRTTTNYWDVIVGNCNPN